MQKIEKILVPYFSTDEIQEIKKLLSVTDDNWLVSSPDLISQNKKINRSAVFLVLLLIFFEKLCKLVKLPCIGSYLTDIIT